MWCNKHGTRGFIRAIIVLTLCCLECRSSRLYFSKCAFGGFSCIVSGGKYNITYQCPANENDPTIHVWQFRAPSTIESLTIANCTNFKVSFQCTGENKPITHLTIINITNLSILKTVNTHTPPTVRFENIANLEYIPENAFSQIKSRMPISGCFNPVRDFQNLYFNKVSIGTIAPKAFNSLKDFGNFSWNEVKVQRLQHLAIEVDNNKSGNFSIRKSNIEICEHLGIKIVGTQALFLENKFVEIYSSGINGTFSTFVFSMNTVDSMQPFSISILSQNVYIVDNKFEYLQSGALEKISPGLLQNNQINFASIRFIYEFSYNSISSIDAGSLNPDMPAYDNVATEIKFHHNSLYCLCENIGWMFSAVGYGRKTSAMQEFYETIIEPEYKNWCSFTSCHLPLSLGRTLVQNGKCLENKTVEDLCKVEDERATAVILKKTTITQNPAFQISVNNVNSKYIGYNVLIFMLMVILLV